MVLNVYLCTGGCSKNSAGKRATKNAIWLKGLCYDIPFKYDSQDAGLLWHSKWMFFVQIISNKGSVSTGPVPSGTVTCLVRIGLAFLRDCLKQFHLGLLNRFQIGLLLN